MRPQAKLSPAPSYYIWEPPKRQIRVILNLDVIDRIKSWVNEAPDSGDEAGGLLLGATREPADGQPPAVTVEHFEPLQITHYRGPAFALSEKEKSRLEKRIRIWNEQHPSALSVVGIVRSHKRRGLYLDVSDFTLFKHYFPPPHSVFLLVRTGATPMAGFFFWEQDDVHLQKTYKEFPFDRTSLAKESAAPSEIISTQAAVSRPPVPAAEPQARKFPVAWIGIAAALVLLTATSWLYLRRNIAPKPRAVSSLELKAVYEPERNIRLTWNPRAPFIAGASGAKLGIDDGPVHRTIDLTPQQLATGRQLYKPSSADVSFVLEVAGKAGRNSESIHTIVPRPEPPATIASAPPVETPARRVTQKPKFTRVSTRHRRRNARRRKQFVAPIVQARTHLPEAPALQAAEPVRLEPSRPMPALAITPRVSPPQTAFAVDFAPAPESKVRTLLQRISTREGSFVPPKPVVRVEPDVPGPIAQSLQRDLRVNFRVSIDKNGRVTDVESLTTGVDHRFVGLADIALRHWTFEPARVNNRAISCRLMVIVTFKSPFKAVNITRS